MRLLNWSKKMARGPRPFFSWSSFGPDGLELRGRGGRGEPRLGVGLELLGDLVGRKMPPRRYHGHPPGISSGAESALYNGRPDLYSRPRPGGGMRDGGGYFFFLAVQGKAPKSPAWTSPVIVSPSTLPL